MTAEQLKTVVFTADKRANQQAVYDVRFTAASPFYQFPGRVMICIYIYIYIRQHV